MSYTAPQYVDTKEQAVLALASTIAGEDKTALGNGSVNTALDVLADVLAGQDVEVPQTNAGAILALAQYVGGGGGAQTLDVNIWNATEDESLMAVLPIEVRYITGYGEGNRPTPLYSDPLPFEHITGEVSGTTLHGVRVSGLPVGAIVKLTISASGVYVDTLEFGVAQSGAADAPLVNSAEDVVPAPVGGFVVAGDYILAKTV